MAATGIVASILALSWCGAMMLATPTLGTRGWYQAGPVPSDLQGDHDAAWDRLHQYLLAIESMDAWARPDLSSLVDALNGALAALDQAQACIDQANSSGAAAWIAEASSRLDVASELLDEATSAYQQVVLATQLGIVIVVVLISCIVAFLAFLVKSSKKRKDEAFLARRIDHDRLARQPRPDGGG